MYFSIRRPDVGGFSSIECSLTQVLRLNLYVLVVHCLVLCVVEPIAWPFFGYRSCVNSECFVEHVPLFAVLDVESV